jgi:TetR/AcrR family transcriptional regulator, cholesterol catabolism regulator
MNELINRISNLFKKYGIKNVTMDDIAKELGISKRTLYQRFKNKNDLIFKVTQFEIKCECKELHKLCNLYPNAIDQLLSISKYLVNKLRNFNRSIIYDMNKYYPQIQEELISKRKEYILKFLKRNFQIGMKQCVYRRNLDFNIINIFYTCLLDIKGFELYHDILNGDFDKMFYTLFMYHICGIANKEGIEYLESQFC